MKGECQMATSVIQIRVDGVLKNKATQVYSDLGIDLSTAIRMFLKRTIMENGIPFPMILPQKEGNSSLKTSTEINEKSKKINRSNMALEEIATEIKAMRQNK